jgi:Icc-related predicted phosphoesterase
MSAFPAVDILIAHNSPKGIHDRDDGIHEGFDGLTNYILEHKPKYLFHGHQHYEQETVYEGTKVICVFGWKVMEI